MATKTVDLIIKEYLHAVQKSGIQAHKAVLFGSYARGTAHKLSDIDVVIIAPELDKAKNRNLINKLWELRAITDSRIEPIPCGEREWETNDSRPLLEIARREGVVIQA